LSVYSPILIFSVVTELSSFSVTLSASC